MSHLNFKQIEEYYQNDKQIDWHDEYKREAWCDGLGPLTLLDVGKVDWMTGKNSKGCGFIRYICSNVNCKRCTDKSLTLVGHHKIIKMNGMDPFGKVEFKETRKKTIITTSPEPVFKNNLNENGDE